MATTINDNSINEEDYRLGVSKGGLGHIKPYNPSNLTDETTYLTTSSKNVPNGIAGLDSNGKVPLLLIADPDIFDHVVLSYTQYGYAAKSMTITIVNYSAFVTYVVTVSDGNYGINEGVITYYPPSYACNVQIVVNGRTINLEIRDNEPIQPYIISPYNEYNNHPNTLGAYTNAYVNGGVTAYTHASSDWQAATDPDFTNIAFSVTANTVWKVSWTQEGLLPNTTYYIRTRHINSIGRVSPWSKTVKITTKASFSNLTEEAKLIASDPAASAKFGHCVTSDLNGLRVAVGSPNKAGTYANQGAVYIFLRTGVTWALEQKIVAGDVANTNEQFGFSVDMSRDGLRLAVGSNQKTVTQPNAGAVYVFKRTGTVWAQEGKLTASDFNANAYLGQSVCFNGTGTKLVAGAYGANVPGVSNNGTAYVYSLVGSTWVQEAKLLPSAAYAVDKTGWSVSMSYDGTRIALGSPYKTIGSSNGAAYVFALQYGNWVEEALLIPDQIQSGSYFGYDVFLSDDASRLVVSSYNKTENAAGQGAVYVFKRLNSKWDQEAKFSHMDYSSNDYFGFAVSGNSNCDRISVGAYLKTSPSASQSGVGYLFERIGDNWKQISRITPSDRAATDAFGWDCDSSRDGLRLIFGAPTDDHSSLTDPGSVYIYS